MADRMLREAELGVDVEPAGVTVQDHSRIVRSQNRASPDSPAEAKRQQKIVRVLLLHQALEADSTASSTREA